MLLLRGCVVNGETVGGGVGTSYRIHFTEEGRVVAVLIAPTHPLKMAWLFLMDESLRRWLAQASEITGEDLKLEATELSMALDSIVPLAVPPVVLDGSHAFSHD